MWANGSRSTPWAHYIKGISTKGRRNLSRVKGSGGPNLVFAIVERPEGKSTK